LLLYWQSVLIDERGGVRQQLEASLVRLKAVGRDSLIPRGLSVLCPFPEEVGLVLDPPYCYSGLATLPDKRDDDVRLDVSTPIHV
jgi:hypothetical protein